MKKTIKKILAVSLAAALFAGTLTACSSKSNNNTETTNTVSDNAGSGTTEEINNTCTMSEFFAKKDRIWFLVEEGLDKSFTPEAVFLTQPDGTMLYVYNKEILSSMGDYAQMSDEEIIDFVKKNAFDIRPQFTASATEECRIFLDNYVKSNQLKYTFNITTDETGNNVLKQDFVYQTYPQIISYINFDGEFYEHAPTSLGGTNDNSAVYTFNYGCEPASIAICEMRKKEVYDSKYITFFADNYDGGAYIFATRYNEDEADIEITEDAIGTNGITVDKDITEIYEKEVIYTEEIRR